MVKNIFKNYIYPIVTLSGSIIGVGFLSLPYITLQVGIWPMLFYFIVLTILMIYINVIFGKISLNTPDLKRFPGFVDFYLGKKLKIITSFLVIGSSFGILLILLIVGGKFLTFILNPFFGGTVLLYTILYLVTATFIIYFGIKIVSKIELLTLFLLSIVSIIILFKGFSQIKIENIFSNNIKIDNWKTLFLPYGAIIFSLGTGYIPETEEMLKGNKKLLKKIIIISTLIPAIFYFLFIFLILGISGLETTESALTGLSKFLGQDITFITLFVGFILTFIAFIMQGLLLKETLIYDIGIKKRTAWLMVCIVPLFLFLLGFNSFIPLISFVGGIFSGIGIILILLMYQKIGGKKIITYPLILLFILGVIFEILSFIY